jgi:hypothetical protein
MEKTFDIAVGSTVWLMHKDRVVSGVVSKIWYTKFISPLDYESIVESEWYTVCDADNKKIDSYRKESLFPRKEDLVNSL